MQCNSCHTEVPNDTVFCPHCGANLSKQQADATQTVSQLQLSLKVANEQISALQQQLAVKKTSSPAGLIVAVVILAFVSIICTALAIGKSSEAKEAQSDVTYYMNRADNYQSQVEELAPYGIYVPITSVYTSDGEGNYTYTDYFVRGAIQYLDFDYSVIKTGDFVDTGQELYVRIFRPDGSMMQGTNSTSDYTFTVPATTGSSNTGWGNTAYTAYGQSGMYVIEFVYNGEVVGCRPVFVN
jgi:uncharacterized Zn finger protein (UPF0148 family)